MKKTAFIILSTIITIMSFSGSGAYAAPEPSINPPTLQWQACPLPPEGIPDAGRQCATLTVPLDYMHPNGQKITVSVSRISAAKPSERRGVLFMNPGGPGGPGLDLPRIATI